mgnify:CR=1 FL=1
MHEANQLEAQEKTARVLELLERPMLLLAKGKSLGVKGVTRFVFIILLFGAVNTFIYISALVVALMYHSEISLSGLSFLLWVILTGFAFTFFAGYKAYRYAIIDALRVVYSGLGPVFKSLTGSLVDKAGEMYSSSNSIDSNKLESSVDIISILKDKFERIPRLLRKGIGFILNRIPFVSMLDDVSGDIKAGNQNEAKDKLYSNMDGFITNTIFGGNNTRYVYWLLPLNIVIQIILIKLGN